MSATGHGRYEADIRWTTHGVAHIRAADWGSLGFGQGWACARDHLPTLADQIVKVRSERAMFHGPGRDDANIASDFGYLALGVAARAEALRDAQPDDARALISGYVAGYNAQLEETRAAGTLPTWCADAPWIRPISELDFYAYIGDVGLLASGRNLAGLLGRAEAPGPDGPVEASPLSALGGADVGDVFGASNGWAFGRDATASGHGIVMANPHFPWGGEARFWECHLTIPGVLDVYGASLVGTPGVQIGFNADVAWAHTVSRGARFTLNRLDLVPGRPTSYRYGDEERAMDSTTHRVTVLAANGGTANVERTLWTSHHGPMVNLPLLGWGTEIGFTLRDTNTDNVDLVAQFLGMNVARSLDDFQQVFATVKGLPWVNTLAADRTGRAWYTDASPTPNLTRDAQDRFVARVATDPVAALLYDARVTLLDGSDPGDEWQDHPDARSPGLIPPAELPQLERSDYVANANDSHWLTHPDEPLEGYSALHGFERSAPTLRTRQNHLVAGAVAATGQATVDSVLAALLDNASLSADLLLDDVVARARAAGTLEDVDLAAAADVLARWDRRAELDSRGAALWREFMASFEPAAQQSAGVLFSEGFDPDDPVATPRGLAPAPADGLDLVILGLFAAIRALETAGVAIDAPLGEVQWAQRGEHRVPVHGGGEGEGLCNILAPVGALASSSIEPTPPPLEPIPGRTARTGLAVGGYRCTYGTSFLMAVELTDDGPAGQGLLAYGQSGDPTSPHHVDGTVAYSTKSLRPLLFTDADIEADPNLQQQTIVG